MLSERPADSLRQPSGLAELLATAAKAVPVPSLSQAKLLERIDHLRDRLSTDRFQLAVLGQFKRGKSTVINALLGVDLLPTGVTPVTAISTFLEAAETLRLRVTYVAGTTEESEMSEPEMMRERLRALVTEDANPKNILGIARVDITLPSQLLKRGVVLIDTPGIGSTFRHNTAAADAILPECDATLFVVSPDPSITEIEMEFLARIRKTVGHLIVVLNKIDILDQEEREASISFLRRVLADEAGSRPETPLFCVSARNALRATKSSRDGPATSGFDELDAYLLRFLANAKRAALSAAVARKASALIDQLRLETEIGLRSLRLPLEDLERRISIFEEAAKQFEIQRCAAADLLAGDRLRVLKELEAVAERLRTEARAQLKCELDRSLANGGDSRAAEEALTTAIVAFFDAALKEVVRGVSERLAAMFLVHRRRADELVGRVRQTAADLLEIPFRAPEDSEAFEAKQDPFWVKPGCSVTLSPLPPDIFDRFLPKSMRRKRLRRRLIEEIDSVLLRNVENLRWATRRNLEDTFRNFGAELDERLALSLAATRGAMKAAFDRRSQHSAAVEAEIAGKNEASLRLSEIAAAIARCAGDSGAAPIGNGSRVDS